MPSLPDKPGTILYIGSGICSDLDRFLSLSPSRIILVEPNPDLELDLLELQDHHDSVEYLQFGVSETSGSCSLNIPNWFDLSSFNPLENLKEYFPNGKILKKARVPCVGVDSLLDQVDIDPSTPNVLVVDTPGYSVSIARFFCDADRLREFDAIILRDFALPVFADSEAISEVGDLLEERGYAGGFDTSLSSETWQEYRYHKSELVEDLQKAKAEIRAFEELLSKANQENIAKEAQQIEQMQAAIDSAQRTSEDALIELALIQDEKKKLKMFLEQAREDLKNAKQDLSISSKNVTDQKEKIIKLESELAGEKDKITSLNFDLKEIREGLTAEQRELSEVRLELEKELANIELEATELELSKNRLQKDREDLDQQRLDLNVQIEKTKKEKKAVAEKYDMIEAEKKSLAADQLTLANSAQQIEIERNTFALRESELSGAIKELELEKIKVQNLEDAATRQDDNLEALQKEYREVKKSHTNLMHENGTLQRLHALKDSDLRDLRNRYEKLLAAKLKQDEALSSVSKKMKMFIESASNNQKPKQINSPTKSNGS